MKENSKSIYIYAHISMYMGFRSKVTYEREYGIKSHVQQIICVFRDDIGNIKHTIMVHGVQRVYKWIGKAVKV